MGLAWPSLNNRVHEDLHLVASTVMQDSTPCCELTRSEHGRHEPFGGVGSRLKTVHLLVLDGLVSGIV